MNTVQHKKKTVTRHEIRMEAPITARDLSDFIHQVDRIWAEQTGAPITTMSDDAYYVTGDEEGLMATFETRKATDA